MSALQPNPVVIPATLNVLTHLAVEMASALPNIHIFSMGNMDTHRLLPEIYVKTNPDNLKFVRGWNYAMEVLEKEFHPDAVWMLNDDVLHEDQNMLDRLWSAMQCDPKMALVTPIFNSPHPIFQKPRNTEYGLRRVPWVDWCVPLVNMQAWREVGPFDEDFVGYGADIDWCARARALGWEFYVHEACAIHHLGSVTTEALGANDMRDVTEMNRLLKKKYGRDWWQLIVNT